jgi:hypothetical protein
VDGPVTLGSSLGSLDWPHRPTLVFSAHFVLTRAHPGKTSRSVTHRQIAPSLEFFSDELPEKKVYLVDMSILSILLSLSQDVTVEKWICAVKRRFLDDALTKCVGLDCEFTTHAVPQRAAVLQLSVSSEILIFQICKTNGVPQLLKDFLKDTTIKFCGAAINNDLRMLRSYGIVIPSAYDLQKVVPNPTSKLTPSLYDLSNATIGTHLESKKRDKKKKDKKKYKKKGEKEEEEDDDDEDELIFGWEKIPLSFNQISYAALDARLLFEIARRFWKLKGYNSHVDRLNLNN